MTEFTELYKNLSNSELLKIIAESEKYNPIAVETAEKEITDRKLSQEEINKVKTSINEQKTKKKLETKKWEKKEEKIKQSATSILDTINPIQNGIQTPEKIIRLITLIFGGIAAYRIYKELDILRFMLSSQDAKWDIGMIDYFFPVIILPLGIFFFWKQRKIGWILLAIFLIHFLTTFTAVFLMSLGQQPSGIPAIDSLLPSIPPISYILSSIFYLGTLSLICKKNIRNIYKIKKQTMILTIGLTLAFVTIFIYSIIG